MKSFKIIFAVLFFVGVSARAEMVPMSGVSTNSTPFGMPSTLPAKCGTCGIKPVPQPTTVNIIRVTPIYGTHGGCATGTCGGGCATGMCSRPPAPYPMYGYGVGTLPYYGYGTGYYPYYGYGACANPCKHKNKKHGCGCRRSGFAFSIATPYFGFGIRTF